MSPSRKSTEETTWLTSGQTWWICLTLITVASFATRLYKIHEPDHVCWDETHFGKMGSWYINRTFFFDVHPPLGKMLIGLAGKLSGYNGSFAFTKPGDKYGDHNYVGMRIFCAALGALIVPFCFIATYDLSSSLESAIFSSCILLLDIGLVTISQYILLDPLLLCFIFGAFMGSCKLATERLQRKAFSIEWLFWLAWTGSFLACSVSVKFVGLFIVTVVGLQTIAQLWNILGDQSVAMSRFVLHFAYRVVFLILFPSFLYMAFFWIHLKVLNHSGSGDGFFSSAFQSQLIGNSLYNVSMPKYVAYGASVTLKSVKTGGGYLHSHWHLYPEGVGARQQQVTGYSHKDDNNKWIIKKFDVEPTEGEEVTLVKNGDLVRLEHLPTSRNLHSHREIAPVTKQHYQVTCYGENGTGDANDVWRVVMVEPKDSQFIQTVITPFRLVHYFVNCALSCNSKQLPKWGYEQMEVSCNPNLLDKSTVWNIEDNHFPRLPNVSFDVFAPSFLDKFFESHAVMFQGNAGLKPKEGEVTSRPWQWLVNYRGQFFSGNEFKIYLLGNPIVWWGNLALLPIYVLLQLVLLLRRHRKCLDSQEFKECSDRLTQAGSWLFIAWSIHYFPFFAMGRVLYYHHYFPAAIFSSLLSGVVLDYVLFKVPRVMGLNVNLSFAAMAAVLSVLVQSFYAFSPLSYGIIGSPDNPNGTTTSSLQHLRWLSSWEF